MGLTPSSFLMQGLKLKHYTMSGNISSLFSCPWRSSLCSPRARPHGAPPTAPLSARAAPPPVWPARGAAWARQPKQQLGQSAYWPDCQPSLDTLAGLAGHEEQSHQGNYFVGHAHGIGRTSFPQLWRELWRYPHL